MKKIFYTFLLLIVLVSCQRETHYHIGKNISDWFLKNRIDSCAFINDSTNQIIHYKYNNETHSYIDRSKGGNDDPELYEYFFIKYKSDSTFEMYFNIETDLTITFFDTKNKLCYPLNISLNSEYYKSININGYTFDDVLYNENIAYISTSRNTNIIDPSDLLYFELGKSQAKFQFKCWYSKKIGLIKYVIISEGKTNSWRRTNY